jgi:hypothetical protein
VSVPEGAMKAFEVKVGGFYVSQRRGLVREVTKEHEDGRVLWRSYDLRDGTATGDSFLCSSGQIHHWADREATAEEVARMGRQGANAIAWAQGAALAAEVLKRIPDELLIGEVQRSGLKVR